MECVRRGMWRVLDCDEFLNITIEISYVADFRSRLAQKTANRLTLEAEKEKDAAEKAVDELKRQLQPKRTRTHDAGDAHEMIAEVDNWDLSVQRREATHVQNRRKWHSGLSTSRVDEISWCRMYSY